MYFCWWKITFIHFANIIQLFPNYYKLVFLQIIIALFYVKATTTTTAIKLFWECKPKPVIKSISFDVSFDATILIMCQCKQLCEALQFYD